MRLTILISALYFVLSFDGLEAMPLREKVAQMLIIGFHDEEVIEKHVLEDKPGGIILFGRNIKNPEQLKNLLENLKTLDKQLLITIDQEGGRVSRLTTKQGFDEPMPSPKQLGEGMENQTYQKASKASEQLKNLGINVNFAPVVDMGSTESNFIFKAERIFHDKPEKMISHAKSFIKGMHKNEIRCALKHFPGHGSSIGDTHTNQVNISETWSEDELMPYCELIEESYADFIMTTHCINRKIDENGLPMTLSKNALTCLLKEKLNFQGVVVTDDLVMKAISAHYSLRESLRLSINAGADMLILGNHDEDLTNKVIETIVDLVDLGEIPETRIDEAIERIRKLKEKLN